MLNQTINTILFLDDNPSRHVKMDEDHPNDNIIHCYTLDDFIDALKSNDHFDVISLDHDLNDFDSKSVLWDGSSATGLDACGFLVNLTFRNKLPDTIIIHSVNPTGAKNMINFLQSRNLNVKWHMFDM